ncbi:MAG: UDP-N-acetylmuramate dehydrogenase [bacterium]|nr:UDP-N-acetylmuramate dehydrogenase [bacterium]
MIRVKKGFPLKKFTTIRIGGLAKFFIVAKTENDLIDAVAFAKKKKLPWYLVGDGSNLIVADRGYKGVIIQNKIEKFARQGREVSVGAGNNLLKFIFKLDRLGFAGMEKMAGIPGTVGGAIYGCAGAYGQEIKDVLVRVRVFDGQKFKLLTKKQCQFGYRESIFKKRKNWIITEATLKLGAGDRYQLLQTSRGIIKLRGQKYHRGLRCPGSFFKNIKLENVKPRALREKFLEKVDPAKIIYGKVPAGYLLDQIGARGMRQGKIRVAGHHGNLVYNPGGGKASEVVILSKRLKALVKNKFGIKIEEEVQYL